MRATGSLVLLSRGPNDHPVVPIVFPTWDEGPLFKWYQELKGDKARSIEKLQIRIAPGVVPHRFVIVHMADESVHRLDRRPNVVADQCNNLNLLKNTPVTTKDELTPFVDKKSLLKLKNLTKCEIELSLGGEVDLKVILSVCYEISTDPWANRYTLFGHNCFFFSWTILMVVSRHRLPYLIPTQERLLKRAEAAFPGLTTYIVEQAVEHFLDMVIDTVTIFRNRAGDTIHQGMNFIGRAAWALPTEVLQFSWRKIFKAHLHFGLRRELEVHVLAQLNDRIVPLCESAITNNQTPEELDAQLWLDKLHTIIKPILKDEIKRILWDSILEAISAGYGEVAGSKLAKDLMDPNLNFTLMGRNATQFYAVWGVVLHGALPAARNAACGKSEGGKVPDKVVSDLASNAGRDAALVSAKQVVENTRHMMRHQDSRDKMWLAIWDIWDACWKEAHPKAQQSSIATINRIVDKLIETGVQIVVDELGDSDDYAVCSRVLNTGRHMWLWAFSKPKMTNAKLQAHLRKVIKSNTLGRAVFEKVDSTMERIWQGVQERLHPAPENGEARPDPS